LVYSYKQGRKFQSSTLPKKKLGYLAFNFLYEKNDLLAFQYLDYYPDNYLKILKRWGNTVYEKENYTNDWNGAALSEGTYFFLLTLKNEEKNTVDFFNS